MKLEEVFDIIENKIKKIQKAKKKVVRIGINGIEGTGKTIFCQNLTNHLVSKKLQAIQITIDGYHNPKAVRYRQGRDSAQGYYEDAYNENKFLKYVLKSSQNKTPYYIESIHNLETDEDVKPIKHWLTNQHILLTDGAYLFKNIFLPYWDFKIYLYSDFTTALMRGIQRDAESLGGLSAAEEKYEKRYHAASKMYMNECQPLQVADMIVNNNNFKDLKIITRKTISLND